MNKICEIISLFRKKEEDILYPNINIVSLGCNCLPRVVLTRHNVKPKKVQGELSCPFDLVAHKTNRITYYIENNFKDYFDDLEFYPYKKNFLDFRQKGLWKKSDETVFFHDKDCKQFDKEKLLNRFKKRIENFNSIMQSDKPILFVQSVVDEEDVENLYNVLKKIRGNKKFKLLIFDLSNIVKKEIENVTILKVPYPSAKYRNRWNRKLYYNSKIGKNFEQKLIEGTKQILDSM